MLPSAFWPEDSVGVFLELNKRIYKKPTPGTLNGRLHFILFSYRVLNGWRKRMGCHQATKIPFLPIQHNVSAQHYCKNTTSTG